MSSPPAGVRGFLHRLTHVGVDPALPRRETKHVVLTNAYAAFGAMVQLWALAWSAASALRYDVRAALALGALCGALSIGLNGLRRHTLASIFLQTSMIVVFFYIGICEPLATEHIGILFSTAVVAFFLFPRRLRRLSVFFAVLSIVAAAAMRIVLERAPDPPQLPGFDPYSIAVGNVVLGIAVLVFFSNSAAAEIERVEDELVEERKRTESVLKREVAHQVAERSRELGSALARPGGGPASPSATGSTRFGARYKVVRPLGEGGMGAVVEVERVTDGALLALKVMTGEVTRDQAARFAREAEIGARVHHPNLVAIVDIGAAVGGAPFLVMELATGGSLEGQRARFGEVPWALSVLRQMAAGLVARTRAASCTATSSRRTSCSTARGRRSSRTSASRGWAPSRWARWTPMRRRQPRHEGARSRARARGSGRLSTWRPRRRAAAARSDRRWTCSRSASSRTSCSRASSPSRRRQCFSRSSASRCRPRRRSTSQGSTRASVPSWRPASPSRRRRARRPRRSPTRSRRRRHASRAGTTSPTSPAASCSTTYPGRPRKSSHSPLARRDFTR